MLLIIDLSSLSSLSSYLKGLKTPTVAPQKDLYFIEITKNWSSGFSGMKHRRNIIPDRWVLLS
jgi:hypothetical protein